MSAALELTGALGAGIVLGLVFFGGLWWTVGGLETAPRPLGRLATSMALRFALVLGGFYALASLAGAQHVVAALVGFTLPRLVLVVRATRRGRGEEVGR